MSCSGHEGLRSDVASGRPHRNGPCHAWVYSVCHVCVCSLPCRTAAGVQEILVLVELIYLKRCVCCTTWARAISWLHVCCVQHAADMDPVLSKLQARQDMLLLGIKCLWQGACNWVLNLDLCKFVCDSPERTDTNKADVYIVAYKQH